MTDGLRREILHNVKNMFGPRIQRAQEEAEKQVQQYANDLVRLQFSDEVLEGLKGPVWSRYVPVTTYLQVTYKTSGYQFQSRFSLPYNIPQQGASFELKEDRAPELYKKFMDAQAPYMQAIQARGELHAQIHTLVNQVVSLKQLVNVWPSALDMVNSHTRQRYHEKTTYTRTKVDVKLDETIKANLLKARIASDI